MKNNYARIIFGLALFSGLLLLLNTVYYKFVGSGADSASFMYSLPVVYSFYFILSSVILAVLTYLSKKNKEQLGYAFLLLTGAKMAISYFMARPILEEGEAASTEKFNFFIVFIVFLAIEAYYTARLLNNKQ